MITNKDGTVTNIKGLPEGRTYFTEIGHSQSYPWVLVRRTDKGVVLASVKVKPDPEWVPKFQSGGFVAQCVNQNDQTWLFESFDDDSDVHTVQVRLTGKGWVRKGTRFVENCAVEFYDFNF